MEGCSKKDEGWLGQRDEQRLELRLGPPGDQDWTTIEGTKKNNPRERGDSVLSLGCFSNMKSNGNSSWMINTNGTPNQNYFFPANQQGNSQIFHIQTGPKNLPVVAKESSQPCSTKTVDLQHRAEKKAFSPASANTAVPNSPQKRSAPAPVVGWPPIRSFRRNLASTSSSKTIPDSQTELSNKTLSEKPAENSSTQKGFLVKINMDGVPIGRKVDLKVHDSYEKLSSAVDVLFRGLLAAQRDSCAAGEIQNKKEGEKEINIIKGILDGSGEYTLVYEDNEGDRMLVGDVPWHMFVSMVKRLRVLKSSDLSTLSFGSKQEKISVDAARK